MRRRLLLTLGALAVVAAYTGVQMLRPLPALRLQAAVPPRYVFAGAPLVPDWPAFGQSALGLEGVGLVGSAGDQTPVPIASVTKLMTALLVVRDHPLAVGQAGPEVQLTATDQALYTAELAAGDSVVAVRAGEALTELQLLEGLLLPSADNLARVLADWDAGSVAAFVVRMNREARALGMGHTRFGDSSGLDPSSSSTATDLLRLAAAVMAEPVLAQVADMASATLPVAGVVHNYDFVLGQAGVVGLKTGWTAKAGGCFVAAARDRVGGRSVVALAAVLGAPGGPISAIRTAEAAAVQMLQSIWPRLTLASLVPGSALLRLVSGWHRPVRLLAQPALRMVGWPGLVVRLRLTRRHLRPALRSGAEVAEIAILSPQGEVGRVALRLASPLPAPSLWWRLIDP